MVSKDAGLSGIVRRLAWALKLGATELRSTWTFRIPKIMDPILAILSILAHQAVVLGTLEVQVCLWLGHRA